MAQTQDFNASLVATTFASARAEFLAPCVIYAGPVLTGTRRRIMTPSVVAKVWPSPSTSDRVKFAAM